MLTSGQEASAVCGIQLIRLLVMKAEGRIGILPAGKLCSDSFFHWVWLLLLKAAVECWSGQTVMQK